MCNQGNCSLLMHWMCWHLNIIAILNFNLTGKQLNIKIKLIQNLTSILDWHQLMQMNIVNTLFQVNSEVVIGGNCNCQGMHRAWFRANPVFFLINHVFRWLLTRYALIMYTLTLHGWLILHDFDGWTSMVEVRLGYEF